MEYYFAYGSNLSIEQMTSRCPSAQVFEKAIIRDYELRFPIHSPSRQGKGVASIHKRKDASAEGVIYTMTKNDLLKLDRFEANGVRYSRKKVIVDLLNSNKKIEVWTYFALHDEGKHYNPSKQYLSLIIKGAKGHGLSQGYVEQLENFSSSTTKVTFKETQDKALDQVSEEGAKDEKKHSS